VAQRFIVNCRSFLYQGCFLGKIPGGSNSSRCSTHRSRSPRCTARLFLLVICVRDRYFSRSRMSRGGYTNADCSENNVMTHPIDASDATVSWISVRHRFRAVRDARPGSDTADLVLWRRTKSVRSSPPRRAECGPHHVDNVRSSTADVESWAVWVRRNQRSNRRS
jgi:hypothetical protein